jgi:hypothetical protein
MIRRISSLFLSSFRFTYGVINEVGISFDLSVKTFKNFTDMVSIIVSLTQIICQRNE